MISLSPPQTPSKRTADDSTLHSPLLPLPPPFRFCMIYRIGLIGDVSLFFSLDSLSSRRGVSDLGPFYLPRLRSLLVPPGSLPSDTPILWSFSPTILLIFTLPFLSAHLVFEIPFPLMSSLQLTIPNSPNPTLSFLAFQIKGLRFFLSGNHLHEPHTPVESSTFLGRAQTHVLSQGFSISPQFPPSFRTQSSF